jgi:hypothetical protein
MIKGQPPSFFLYKSGEFPYIWVNTVHLPVVTIKCLKKQLPLKNNQNGIKLLLKDQATLVFKKMISFCEINIYKIHKTAVD